MLQQRLIDQGISQLTLFHPFAPVDRVKFGKKLSA